MIAHYTARRPVWQSGVLWELEVQFSIDNDNGVILEGAEFVGWYPELNSRDRDYVTVGVKIEVNEVGGDFYEIMMDMALEKSRWVDERYDGDY